MNSKSLIKTLTATIFVISAILGFTGHKALALSGSDWQAGKILDDSVLYNTNTLTSSEIQTFLNSKLAACDSSGSQTMSYYYNSSTGQVNNSGSGSFVTSTRAVYGQRYATWYNAHPYFAYVTNESLAPYTCLKDYSQNFSTMSSDAYCSAINGGTMSAANIIKAVSTACGINPEVLIVTLQKEQGLLTDDWPWTNEYQFATGFCVYDNPNNIPPSCQGTSGFFNQVYYAARQFKKYAAAPNNFNYQGNQTAFIPYSPDGNCGGSNVAIQTQATADLYNYTPYQPNQGALAGLSDNSPGGTAPCGAYGNRNFWWYFWEWFGSPLFSASSITMTNISQPNLTPALGETISYTVKFTNNLSSSITYDAVGIVGRLGNVSSGANRDFGWQPLTLAANSSQTVTFTTTVKDLGDLYVWPAINYKGTYLHFNNWGAKLTSHIPNIGASLSPISSPLVGQTDNFSVTIKNFESHAINLDAAGIPIRFYGAYNYDTGWASSISIAGNGGSSAPLTGSIDYDKPGPYTEWVSARIGNQYITISPTYNLKVSNPSLSPSNIQLSYTTTPDLNPALGEDVTVAFSLKNNLPVPVTIDAIGVVGRYNNPYNGANRDFGWHPAVTFAASGQAGDTQPFSFTTNVSDLKNFYAWVAINYQGAYIHYNNWGFMMTPHLPNLTLSSPLTINNAGLGNSSSISASIKNNEPHQVKYSAAGIPIRFYSTYNYDLPWQGPGILDALNASSTDHIDLSGNIVFDKHGPYTIWASVLIQGRFITVGSPQTVNL